MKTRFSHAAAFGMAAAMSVIAFSLIVYLAGLHQGFNNLSYPILITILCVGVRKWRLQNGGYMTFGDAYKHLMLQSLVYCLIMMVWTVLFVVYIAPGLMEDQMLMQRAKMEEQGIPEAQIEMGMKFGRMMAQPGILAASVLIMGMAIYAVVNLIIAAIMKKDPPPFDLNMGGQNNPSAPNMPYGGTPNQQYENLANQPPSNLPPQS